MHTQQAFAPSGRSVSRARQFVRQVLGEWDAEDLVDEVVLATSELVTNAVIHAGTSVRIALNLEHDVLRLEVQDLHPHRALPLGVEVPSDDSEHGRGLFIAAALASSWGVDYTAGTKRVWITLERDADRDTTPAPVRTRRTAAPTPTGIAVVELSPAGAVTGWNADATRLFGWSPEEVLDVEWRDLTDDPQPDWTGSRWQGRCVVRRKEGEPMEAFGSRVPGPTGHGAILLLVPLVERALLQAAEPAPPVGPDPLGLPADALGLPADALGRLGLQAYLDLVVERARDVFSARAAYLLVSRDLEGDYEVAAVSGMDVSVRGTHVSADELGAPDLRNAKLPVVLTDVEVGATSWFGTEEVRSLVLAPVAVEGRVVGALGVVSDRTAGFTDEQAVLLQRAAGAAASAADRARLRASERERRGWLGFLAEAADLLAGSLDQEMTMAITGQIVVPRLATWCAVYLEDRRGKPVLQQVWHRDEQGMPPLRAGLERRDPDRLAEDAEVLLDAAVQSVPLVTRGRRIGALVLGRRPGDPLQGEGLVVAESVARRAALAIDNARAHGELQSIGEALQRSLLPASIPTPPAFDVGVVYEAAGEGSLAGGDFYDVFPVAGGRWCFAVGDVCGTGAGAAAVTGLARHTIRALALTGLPVDSVLERLNTAILEEGERGRFLTAVCGVLEPQDDGRIDVTLVCAGHPPPFVVRRAGGAAGPAAPVAQVGRPQPLLGVVEKVAFVTDRAVLQRGDLLVAVTDGVLERREGHRMLEERGVMDELAQVADLSAQAVAERLRRLVGDFSPVQQTDDLAVLVIKAGR